MIPVVGSARHPQIKWSARYKRRRLLPAERRGRHRPIEPVSASNGGRELSPAATATAAPQQAKEAYCSPPLHTAECVDHIREPAQFMGKALPQLRWIFIAFADVEKAASAVNGTEKRHISPRRTPRLPSCSGTGTSRSRWIPWNSPQGRPARSAFATASRHLHARSGMPPSLSLRALRSKAWQSRGTSRSMGRPPANSLLPA